MTERKHFKKRVRARSKKTGESYTTARQHVIRQAQPAEELDEDWLKEITGMRSQAVEAKTGRGWNEWIALLDAAQARKMSHRDIARYLHEREGVAAWWAQMVTVGYERVRGLRAVHEKADGFSMNKSKTLKVPLSVLFEAWDNEERRKSWLPEPLEVRRSTPEKSMRITWGDGRTSVDVYFYAKGEAKSQVNVQHNKLADGKEVQSYKALWTEKLSALQDLLLPKG